MRTLHVWAKLIGNMDTEARSRWEKIMLVIVIAVSLTGSNLRGGLVIYADQCFFIFLQFLG